MVYLNLKETSDNSQKKCEKRQNMQFDALKELFKALQREKTPESQPCTQRLDKIAVNRKQGLKL